MPDYLAFVGATASLASELISIRHRLSVVTIASPVPKQIRWTTQESVKRAIVDVQQKIVDSEDLTEASRLTVWAYVPKHQNIREFFWQALGRAAWIEFVPRELIGQDKKTRQYIEQRYVNVRQFVHEVSNEVYNLRNRSPFILPLSNFGSDILNEIRSHWYTDFDLAELRGAMMRVCNRFKKAHAKVGSAYRDSNSRLYEPARPEICHGMPHPAGDNGRCFVMGRYRYGAAVFPGFHYDVKARRGLLTGMFYDCDGVARDVGAERRAYINVFPNDHLLPKP